MESTWESTTAPVPVLELDTEASVVSRGYLESCSVIVQVANEIILCVKDGIMCAFDQHACHERVRLELLEKEVYDGCGRHSVRLPVTVDLPWNLDDDLCALDSSSPLSDAKIATQLATWGIAYRLQPNPPKVTVTAMPAFFFWSARKPTPAAVQNFVASLVREFLSATSSHQFDRPSTVHDFLATRSCRGAIMFGTPLTRADALMVIAQLRLTALPFQCAHGRPSVVPLVRLTQDKPRMKVQQRMMPPAPLPRRFCAAWPCSPPSLAKLSTASPRPVVIKIE